MNLPPDTNPPGLGAEELTVTQPAEEGVIEAVPEEKHRLRAEGRWGRWALGSLFSELSLSRLPTTPQR